jgi:hypothetical protein
MRDAATGFATTARCATPDKADVWFFPDALGLLLARLIPAASMRDAAAGFAITARWAAPAMADVAAAFALAGVGSGASICVVPAPPTRERRSGLEVKYLQERKKRKERGSA